MQSLVLATRHSNCLWPMALLHVSFISQDISKGNSPCLVLWQRGKTAMAKPCNNSQSFRLDVEYITSAHPLSNVCHTAKLHINGTGKYIPPVSRHHKSHSNGEGCIILLQGERNNWFNNIIHHSDPGQVISRLFLPLWNENIYFRVKFNKYEFPSPFSSSEIHSGQLKLNLGRPW